ncbi:uncharacterized protein LOC144566749 isoform X2 [Carex rostrata]
MQQTGVTVADPTRPDAHNKSGSGLVEAKYQPDPLGLLVRNPLFRHCQEVSGNMHCSSASSSPIFTSRDYSKGRLYLVSPKFVKLGRFAGKERLVLPMNCTSSSSSSSNHGIEYSSEMLQQQIEGDKDAVMIVDHGSRREESNLMLNEFVKMFRARMSYQIVEPAHMELAEPTIKDAFAKCVQHGATRVIVSPFFLFPGRHWHKLVVAESWYIYNF